MATIHSGIVLRRLRERVTAKEARTVPGMPKRSMSGMQQ